MASLHEYSLSVTITQDIDAVNGAKSKDRHVKLVLTPGVASKFRSNDGNVFKYLEHGANTMDGKLVGEALLSASYLMTVLYPEINELTFDLTDCEEASARAQLLSDLMDSNDYNKES